MVSRVQESQGLTKYFFKKNCLYFSYQSETEGWIDLSKQ